MRYEGPTEDKDGYQRDAFAKAIHGCFDVSEGEGDVFIRETLIRYIVSLGSNGTVSFVDPLPLSFVRRTAVWANGPGRLDQW